MLKFIRYPLALFLLANALLVLLGKKRNGQPIALRLTNTLYAIGSIILQLMVYAALAQCYANKKGSTPSVKPA